MQSSPLVIIALVGLSLVCVGLVAVAALLLARRVLARAVDTAADDGTIRRRSISPRPDLRAIAQSQDFDAALARQAEKRTPQAPTSNSFERLPETPFPDAPPALGRRSNTRRAPNRSDEDADDALADFADDL